MSPRRGAGDALRGGGGVSEHVSNMGGLGGTHAGWVVSRGSLPVLALLILLTLACGPAASRSGAPDDGPPRSGGTLSMAIRSDPTGWDPWGNQRGNDPVRMAIEMTFSPLLAPAANTGESCAIVWEGELAESWQLAGDRGIEFKLREGIHWPNKAPLNGRALKASDVVYTMEERVKKGPAGTTFPTAAVFDRAVEVDATTVRFVLKQPFNFIDAFFIGGGGWVVPPETAGPDGKEWLEKPDLSWIGTGPFLFDQYQSGVKVAFKKNQDYFKAGKPYLDRVELLVMPDEATKLAALRSGLLDVYPKVGPSSMEDIKRANPEMFIKSCLSNFQAQLKFRLDKPPFNDERVRQAVSMAINREVIVKNVLLGQGAPVYHLYPLDPEVLKLEAYPPNVRRLLEYRPDEAKKLLAEAGYPQGIKTSMVWTQFYGSPWNEIAEAMVTMFKEAGIDTELKLTEYGAFLRVASSGSGTGEYEGMALSYSNLYSIDHVGAELHGKINRTDSWNMKKAGGDPKLEAMIEELWGATEPEKHKALAKEMQVYLAQKAYSVRSPSWGNGVMAQRWVKNLGWRGTDKIYTNLVDQVWISK